MKNYTRQSIPGWLKSPDVAKELGLTESQFRKHHAEIPSIQLHQSGPKFFKVEDVAKYRELQIKIWKEEHGA